MVRKTTFVENGCWLWNGSQDQKGYGQICLIPGLTPEKTHRISAIFFLNYDWRSPYIVLHKKECLNRHCWNPEHLYVGTHHDNTMDALELGSHANQYGKTELRWIRSREQIKNQ